MNLTLLLLSLVLSLVNSDCGGEFKILCYFSSWTGIHPDAKNCTHMVYTFARIEDDNTLTGMSQKKLISKRSTNTSFL
jgi:hypothetical protein